MTVVICGIQPMTMLLVHEVVVEYMIHNVVLMMLVKVQPCYTMPQQKHAVLMVALSRMLHSVNSNDIIMTS